MAKVNESESPNSNSLTELTVMSFGRLLCTPIFCLNLLKFLLKLNRQHFKHSLSFYHQLSSALIVKSTPSNALCPTVTESLRLRILAHLRFPLSTPRVIHRDSVYFRALRCHVWLRLFSIATSKLAPLILVEERAVVIVVVAAAVAVAVAVAAAVAVAVIVYLSLPAASELAIFTSLTTEPGPLVFFFNISKID